MIIEIILLQLKNQREKLKKKTNFPHFGGFFYVV